MAVAPFVRAYEKYDHFPLNSSSIQSRANLPFDPVLGDQPGSGDQFLRLHQSASIGRGAATIAATTEESILEIALAAGFNSKATFNTLFKSSTGLTPRQFQRQQVRNPDSGRIMAAKQPR